MKKVFDQTVRDLKREVNKKVLKVPGIEQKVLDATSNEPWGPHGSLLADIALATRNYHEYQMIMAVVWKRINDTGKNWRHVYKALTVLEYLVAHGSERVIDEIREHAYQISTLSDFQYIDSSGRDQGSNVRKKSQSLVVLVNDKERIIEVRQKAAANRDKFRSTSSSGGMYRPGGYGDRYDDDRYGSRDDDRYGRNGDSYGREREWGYRDDDRYGRNGDSYSRDGDRYGREYEERYGRDGYRDDDYSGRSRSIDDNQYGPRSRSSDRDRERAFDDDGQYSSRGPRGDDSQDGRRLDRKFSEQNISAPPSYEEAISESRSPVHSERDGETPAAAAPRASSPPSNLPTSSPPSNLPTSSQPVSNQPSQPINSDTPVSPPNQEVQAFDEFDPRGAISATPANANNAEVDLLGSLALAIVPTTTTSEAESTNPNSVSASTFVAAPLASNVTNQPFEDPFGDTPFKAIPSDTTQVQLQISDTPFRAELPHAGAPKADAGSNFDFGDSLAGITYSTPSFSTVQTNSEFLPQELSTSHQNTDILADILPPSGPSPAITSQQAFSASSTQTAQPVANAFGSFQQQPGSHVTGPPNMVPQIQNISAGQHGNYLSTGPTAPVTSHVAPQMPTGPTPQFTNGPFAPQQPFTAPNNGNFYTQQGTPAVSMNPHMAPQTTMGPAGQFNSGNFLPQQSSASQVAPQVTYNTPSGLAAQQSNDVLGNLLGQTGSNPSVASQPTKDKFETKSAVWADTLSRGLVNLNISGPKTNPLADIGVDFDAINRKERRFEKPAATPVTSTVTMGKAMGSGSGMGRAGAGALRPLPNPMMGSGMGMGMGGGPGAGMGLGPYGGMNQTMGMGMGMNMGMGQPTMGLPPGPNIPGGYNPMMGTGGYGPQQPYGGYR